MASLDWLWSVYEHVKESPRDDLFAYFRGPGRGNDLTATIMNEVKQLIEMVLPPSAAIAVSAHPRHGDAQMDICLCARQLFCCVLEYVLQQNFPIQQAPDAEANQSRFKARARQPPAPGVREALNRADLHDSLLVCALEIVAAVALQDESKHFPWATNRAGRDSCGASLWMAIHCFLDCFGAGSAQPMPQELQQYLRTIQTVLLECYVMATGSTFYEFMCKQGGGFMYDEDDSTLLRKVMAAYNTLALSRTLEVACALLEALPHDQRPVNLATEWPRQCAAVMDALLCEHLDLCFGQHMFVMVACVLYAAAKFHKMSLSFRRIMQVMVGLVPWHSEGIFTRVEVSPPSKDAPESADIGDIRDFYNGRFIASMASVVKRVCSAEGAAGSTPAVQPAAAATPHRAAVAARAPQPGGGAAKSRMLLLGASEGKENAPEASQPEVSLLMWQQTQVTQQVTAPFAQMLSPARVTSHGAQLGRLLQGGAARQGTPSSRASSMR